MALRDPRSLGAGCRVHECHCHLEGSGRPDPGCLRGHRAQEPPFESLLSYWNLFVKVSFVALTL